MAAAVRLTSPGAQAPSTSPALVGCGPFGRRVVELLATGWPQPRTADVGELEAVFAASEGPVVMALWRPDNGLCERADELAFGYGRVWLPVIAEHPVIRVGPLICPPSGPCFGCYLARRRQHGTEHEVAGARDTAYERDSTTGPAGYLPHHARLAAGIAEQLIRTVGRDPSAGALPGGRIVTIGLANGGLSASRVIACHDCPRQAAGDAVARPVDLAALVAGLPRPSAATPRGLREMEVTR